MIAGRRIQGTATLGPGLCALLNFAAEQTRDLVDVLIATSGEANHDDVGLVQFPGGFEDVGDGMGGFHGGNDAFVGCERLKSFQSFRVGGALVGDAAAVLPVAVFRADAGIVETRRD